MSLSPASPRTSPTTFLGLVAHPLRWRLLRELARSDLMVRELSGLVRQRQGLVSYHLGRLRSARLVSMRRSSADGRDAYYAVDLARFGELMGATAGALHPALQLRLAAVPPADSSIEQPPVRVLFLCTGNSARSQMAEALIERLGDGLVVACSAGSHPKALHPNAVRAMKARGIDISDRRTKGFDALHDRQFDLVVTLCDWVREVCPDFPGQAEMVHWSLPDPARLEGSDAETYPAFDDLANELATRIRFLLLRVAAIRNHQEGQNNA